MTLKLSVMSATLSNAMKKRNKVETEKTLNLNEWLDNGNSISTVVTITGVEFHVGINMVTSFELVKEDYGDNGEWYIIINHSDGSQIRIPMHWCGVSTKKEPIQ